MLYMQLNRHFSPLRFKYLYSIKSYSKISFDPRKKIFSKYDPSLYPRFKYVNGNLIEVAMNNSVLEAKSIEINSLSINPLSLLLKRLLLSDIRERYDTILSNASKSHRIKQSVGAYWNKELWSDIEKQLIKLLKSTDKPIDIRDFVRITRALQIIGYKSKYLTQVIAETAPKLKNWSPSNLASFSASWRNLPSRTSISHELQDSVWDFLLKKASKRASRSPLWSTSAVLLSRAQCVKDTQRAKEISLLRHQLDEWGMLKGIECRLKKGGSKELSNSRMFASLMTGLGRIYNGSFIPTTLQNEILNMTGKYPVELDAHSLVMLLSASARLPSLARTRLVANLVASTKFGAGELTARQCASIIYSLSRLSNGTDSILVANLTRMLFDRYRFAALNDSYLKILFLGLTSAAPAIPRNTAESLAEWTTNSRPISSLSSETCAALMQLHAETQCLPAITLCDVAKKALSPRQIRIPHLTRVLRGLSVLPSEARQVTNAEFAPILAPASKILLSSLHRITRDEYSDFAFKLSMNDLQIQFDRALHLQLADPCFSNFTIMHAADYLSAVCEVLPANCQGSAAPVHQPPLSPDSLKLIFSSKILHVGAVNQPETAKHVSRLFSCLNAIFQRQPSRSSSKIPRMDLIIPWIEQEELAKRSQEWKSFFDAAREVIHGEEYQKHFNKCMHLPVSAASLSILVKRLEGCEGVWPPPYFDLSSVCKHIEAYLPSTSASVEGEQKRELDVKLFSSLVRSLGKTSGGFSAAFIGSNSERANSAVKLSNDLGPHFEGASVLFADLPAVRGLANSIRDQGSTAIWHLSSDDVVGTMEAVLSIELRRRFLLAGDESDLFDEISSQQHLSDCRFVLRTFCDHLLARIRLPSSFEGLPDKVSTLTTLSLVSNGLKFLFPKLFTQHSNTINYQTSRLARRLVPADYALDSKGDTTSKHGESGAPPALKILLSRQPSVSSGRKRMLNFPSSSQLTRRLRASVARTGSNVFALGRNSATGILVNEASLSTARSKVGLQVQHIPHALEEVLVAHSTGLLSTAAKRTKISNGDRMFHMRICRVLNRASVIKLSSATELARDLGMKQRVEVYLLPLVSTDFVRPLGGKSRLFKPSTYLRLAAMDSAIQNGLAIPMDQLDKDEGQSNNSQTEDAQNRINAQSSDNTHTSKIKKIVLPVDMDKWLKTCKYEGIDKLNSYLFTLWSEALQKNESMSIK